VHSAVLRQTMASVDYVVNLPSVRQDLLSVGSVNDVILIQRRYLYYVYFISTRGRWACQETLVGLHAVLIDRNSDNRTVITYWFYCNYTSSVRLYNGVNISCVCRRQTKSKDFGNIMFSQLIMSSTASIAVRKGSAPMVSVKEQAT
jgi:hypothetical protein